MKKEAAAAWTNLQPAKAEAKAPTSEIRTP